LCYNSILLRLKIRDYMIIDLALVEQGLFILTEDLEFILFGRNASL